MKTQPELVHRNRVTCARVNDKSLCCFQKGLIHTEDGDHFLIEPVEERNSSNRVDKHPHVVYKNPVRVRMLPRKQNGTFCNDQGIYSLSTFYTLIWQRTIVLTLLFLCLRKSTTKCKLFYSIVSSPCPSGARLTDKTRD